jgi:hypothetical protein
LLPVLDADPFGDDPRLIGTRGSVRCQSGDAAGGLASLREAIRRFLDQGTYVYDPDIAVLRRRAGLCALITGQRLLAAECAREARRAFEEQPLVGPRYRAFLLKLEQALQPSQDKSARQTAASSEAC